MLFGYIKNSVLHYTTISGREWDSELSNLETSVSIIKNDHGFKTSGLQTVRFMTELGSYEHLPSSVAYAESVADGFGEGQGVQTLVVGRNTETIYKTLLAKGQMAIVWYDQGGWLVFDKEKLTPIDNFSTPYELYERNKWFYSKPRTIRTIEEYNDWVNFLMQAQDDGCYFRGHGFPPSGLEVIMDEVNQLDEYNAEQWLPMLVISDFDTEPCHDDELDVVKATIVSKHFF